MFKQNSLLRIEAIASILSKPVLQLVTLFVWFYHSLYEKLKESIISGFSGVRVVSERQIENIPNNQCGN